MVRDSLRKRRGLKKLRGGVKKETKKSVKAPSKKKFSYSKKKLPQLSRNNLSGLIQWLIDFAGTDNVLEAVIHYLDIKGTRFIETSDKNLGVRNTMVFSHTAGDGSMGHWIYFDRQGKERNSYKLGHQKDGSNQCCQSFALLYLIQDHCSNNPYCRQWAKYADRLTSDKGENICVVVDFWTDWINYCQQIDKQLSEWML